MKKCYRCKQLKDKTEFFPHKRTTDRLGSWCRECTAVYQRLERSKHKEWADSEKLRRKSDSYREWQKKYHASREIQNKARQTIRTLIRSGVLKREPCFVCGKTKSQGHHPDYSKPKEVLWVCPKHHMEIHRKYGKLETYTKQL